MAARGRDTASRASSVMQPTHVDLINRPDPNSIKTPTIYAGMGDRVHVEYVEDRLGGQHPLGLGCQHMADADGHCHIPQCQPNIDAVRARRSAEKASTGGAPTGG